VSDDLFANLPGDDVPAVAPGMVRFGTSSFSCKDWVGPFYPPGTQPGDYLRHYATVFDTVEVDATYYAIPSDRVVSGWAEKTPPGFLLSAKFPRSIVHGGEAERPDARKVLVEDAVGNDRDDFVAVMRRLGPRAGPLVLQFPFFSQEAFPAVDPFLARLDRFFATLPKDFAYGVEVRNPDWLGRPLRDLLASHRVALVLVDQAWMPHADRLDALDPVTAEFAYVRLLGDRVAIERLTTTWGREVIDHGPSLLRWAAYLDRLASAGVKTLFYVNNHYAGHGPATVHRLRSMYDALRAAKRAAP
jgi:uncharacterized protein YecE (DUF72 family)